MSELWHVTAMATGHKELYFLALSVGESEISTPAAATALIVAMDRLVIEGVDPRQILFWRIERVDDTNQEMNG